MDKYAFSGSHFGKSKMAAMWIPVQMETLIFWLLMPSSFQKKYSFPNPPKIRRKWKFKRNRPDSSQLCRSRQPLWCYSLGHRRYQSLSCSAGRTMTSPSSCRWAIIIYSDGGRTAIITVKLTIILVLTLTDPPDRSQRNLASWHKLTLSALNPYVQLGRVFYPQTYFLSCCSETA